MYDLGDLTIYRQNFGDFTLHMYDLGDLTIYRQDFGDFTIYRQDLGDFTLIDRTLVTLRSSTGPW